MTDSSSDLLKIFWEEVTDYLKLLNQALLQVEVAEGEDQTNILKEMNRYAHSMKGAARAVGLSVIETTAHYMEEVFHSALNDDAPLLPEVADTLYDGLDLIQNIADGQENNPEVVTEVLANLERIVGKMIGVKDEDDNQNGTVSAKQLKEESTEIPAVSITSTTPIPAVEQTDVSPTLVIPPLEETLRLRVSKIDQLMAEATELVIARMQSEERHRRMVELQQQFTRWQREWRSARSAYVRLARRMQDQDEEMVGELRTLIKFLESNERNLFGVNREVSRLSQTLTQDHMHLSSLADQLQDDIANLRVMPFDTIVGGFRRMVRDLARDTGKQAHLEITGATVEIDKTVLEALKDPLMHLLRNALDHGLELPSVREAAGKPPTGYIEITVGQRGSEIVITIQDDGGGINLERIRKKAVKEELITERDAASASPDELYNMIFQSGFTTSVEVTAISGRGLGMDIVRDRIESLRGRVSVQSEAGKGTTITLSVPVSLTRIRCIILRLGEEQYAMPSIAIAHMDRLDRDVVFTAKGKEMITLNERPVHLASLGAILNIPMSSTPEDAQINIISLHTADRTVAFEVDDLSSETELVLKPLGHELEQAPYVAGAALLGTGEVIIVLDANDLIRRASSQQLPARRTVWARPVASTTPIQRRLRILVVDDSITTRTLEKNILETAGFDVQVAIDGVEAWMALSEQDFDVVISDVEMPNMNGLELARRIKDHTQTQHIPVILLTSLSKPEQREAGLRAGANAYLVKSQFNQGELLETIQSVI